MLYTRAAAAFMLARACRVHPELAVAILLCAMCNNVCVLSFAFEGDPLV